MIYDRILQNTIIIGCIAMVTIVVGAWIAHSVTPQRVAPSPATLTV